MRQPSQAELTAQLEALVAQQRERIAQLEALVEGGQGGATCEDCRQLHAIVEAQEVALNEQRQILESQSGVIDELSRQLQAQLQARQAEADLEALVEEQRGRISQLEAAAGRQPAAAAPGGAQSQEVLQLHALIEAQETAMDEQRQVIANQSSLIDELNGYVQSHLCGEAATPRAGNLSDIPECAKARGAAGPGPAGPGGAAPIAAAARTAPRRKPNDAGSPPPPVARSQGAGLSRRSLREQHLAQQREKDPPRPRPNSVLGGRPPGGSAGSSANGSTPRARSTTADRLNSRCSSPQPARGSSPRGPVRQQSGIPRRAGGPVPPSLPLLRQEA
mmetsp:Transcript_74660/g.218837  ORF Transcript_74660/g.218837 Transcript_74660/m.218837 type:complete len:333 (+) Transcript_74660:70-1068(+)